MCFVLWLQENDVTKSDVSSALSCLLKRGGSDFRKLSVQVVGNPKASGEEKEDGDEEEDEEDAEDADEDAVYSMLCQVPEKKEGDAVFVEDLKQFRRSLKVHPVLRIVE